MFKWLTRNDGRRRAKAGRRLGSARGAVFSEFALIMPIALMVCSALIEIIGFWDAEIMANHAAWTVGRIAMVRGADGMAFGGSGVTEGTGTPRRGLPQALGSALEKLYPGGSGTLADRGKIATLFLMSTCGIGYFGQTPKDADAGAFGDFVIQAYDTFKTGFIQQTQQGGLDFTKDIISTIKTEVLSKVGGTTSLLGLLVGKVLFDGILTPIIEKALGPVFGKWAEKAAEGLGNLAQTEAVEPVKTAFSSGVLASRQKRQLYGAALRMARSGNAVLVTDKVSLLTDTAKKFVFSGENPLNHPLVADTRLDTDGYYVTKAGGWPPENKAHKLLRIDVRWPYEAGWVFPVLSGKGKATAAPAAIGHSMVFPQPNLRDANLYSSGAAPFAGPDYDPNAEGEVDALCNDMTNYLAAARFCMQFRICEEEVVFESYYWNDRSVGIAYCPQLAAALGLDSSTHGYFWSLSSCQVPCFEGDYLMSWNQLTGDACQTWGWWGSAFAKDSGYSIRPEWYYHSNTNYPYWVDWGWHEWRFPTNFTAQFDENSYHNNDYFHWDGWYHQGYQWELCRNKGDLPAGRQWGTGTNAPYCHQGDTMNVFPTNILYNYHSDNPLYWSYQSRARTDNAVMTYAEFCPKVIAFAGRNKVNIPHLCAWQTPGAFERWKEDDKAILEKSVQLSGSNGFQRVMALVHDEAEEIRELLEGGGEDILEPLSGNVYDPDSLDIMDKEGSALDKARGNWEEIKAKLRQCLHELEDIAVELRTLYAGWTDEEGKSHPGLEAQLESCLDDRKNAVSWGFAQACMDIVFDSQDPTILDEGNEARFLAYFRTSEQDGTGGRLEYPIALRTAELLPLLDRYEALTAAALEKELEYGRLLGLKSGNKYLPDGMAFEDSLGAAEKPEFTDQEGTLLPGSDTGALIDNDRQKYETEGWKWKK